MALDGRLSLLSPTLRCEVLSRLVSSVGLTDQCEYSAGRDYTGHEFQELGIIGG